MVEFDFFKISKVAKILKWFIEKWENIRKKRKKPRRKPNRKIKTREEPGNKHV
jgi:hypothetical protein